MSIRYHPPRMTGPAGAGWRAETASRFAAFVAERHPFALIEAVEAFDTVAAGREPRDPQRLDGLRTALAAELERRLQVHRLPDGIAETTPRVPARARIDESHRQLIASCDGFLRRLAIEA